MKTKPSICKSIRFLCIAAVVAFICAASSDAADQSVLAVSRSEIAEGVVILHDGRPFVIPPEAAKSNLFTFEPAPGLAPIEVSVYDDPVVDNAPLYIPVRIEDKVLAYGVTLRLITPKGAEAEIYLPPRKVFLSIPINIPLRQETHPDFMGKNVVIYVIPKITKKAQVDVSKTATDGVVADIKYEGIAYLKLKDLLNRTNRRDMDGTLFFSKRMEKSETKHSIFIENLFEKYDKRDLAVMRDHKLSDQLQTKIRLDSLQNLHSISFGTNLRLASGKAGMEAGNVDRRVKNWTHTSFYYGDERLMGMVRFQGIEFVNPRGERPLDVNADRVGWQVAFNEERKNSTFTGVFGNIKVEDFNDQGEIDDHFDFIFTLAHSFGQQQGYSRKKFLISGEHELEYYGHGSATWMRSDIDVNLSYKLYNILYLRFNNDFARVTGRPRVPLWENFFVSLMRVQNYFDPKDPLNKYNLESVYVDMNWEREGRAYSFTDSVKVGFSRYTRIYKYDVPVDIYLETDKKGKLRPGAGISIRRYL